VSSAECDVNSLIDVIDDVVTVVGSEPTVCIETTRSY